VDEAKKLGKPRRLMQIFEQPLPLEQKRKDFEHPLNTHQLSRQFQLSIPSR